MKNIQKNFFLSLFFYLLVLGVIIWFGIFNLGKSTKNKINQIKKTRSQIEFEKQKSQKLTELEETFNLLLENEEKITEALPFSKNSGKLLAQMEVLAQEEECLLSEFKFSQIDGREETAGTNKDVKEGGIEKLPFSFTIEADYSSFLRFLEGLEKFPRIVKIETISVELKEGKLKVAINAFSYFKAEK